MLESSFVFLDGIGAVAERKLWEIGVRSWNDFLKLKEVKGISGKRKKYYDRQIMSAKKALQQENYNYFLSVLPKKEMWRLYSYLKDSCCFLDVEVDGYGKIIVLTLFDKFESKTFVRGVNLEREIFEKEIRKYKLIVTYNGSAFDIPKIEKEFKRKMDVPHIDLKPLCLRLGLVGGLKEVEKQLGIERPANLKGHAVDLWKAFFASGDKEWLELLVKYNEEDAVNLHRVLEKCLARLKLKHGLE